MYITVSFICILNQGGDYILCSAISRTVGQDKKTQTNKKNKQKRNKI
jgi:hypothetical protein